jgi:hypothetical protein
VDMASNGPVGTMPLFRDEFIHPDRLPKAHKGEPLINLFGGFAGDQMD